MENGIFNYTFKKNKRFHKIAGQNSNHDTYENIVNFDEKKKKTRKKTPEGFGSPLTY